MSETPETEPNEENTAPDNIENEEIDDMETDGEVVDDKPEEDLPPAEPLTVGCPLDLEKYLRAELADVRGATFIVQAAITEPGDVTFMIRPHNKDGLTRDFEVIGDLTKNVTRLLA